MLFQGVGHGLIAGENCTELTLKHITHLGVERCDWSWLCHGEGLRQLRQNRGATVRSSGSSKRVSIVGV